MTACPKVPETYHLIGEAELAIMKKTAYLVSVTRGSILVNRHSSSLWRVELIAGAGLDGAEMEPVPPDSPLWDTPNLIITLQRAGVSQHQLQKTFEFFCDNLRCYLKGEKLENIVDKNLGF